MLNPSMGELMKKVGNRYLLVNLAAQRARDLAEQAEETNTPLPEKAVQMALDDINDGTIRYCAGPKEDPKPVSMHISTALGGMLDLDYSDEEEVSLDDMDADDSEEEQDDEDSYDDKDDE